MCQITAHINLGRRPTCSSTHIFTDGLYDMDVVQSGSVFEIFEKENIGTF